MRVEILNGLGTLTVVEATRVLVTTDDGTPIALASVWMGGKGEECIKCGHAGEPGFAHLLAMLGIDRTVVTTVVTPKRLIEIGP